MEAHDWIFDLVVDISTRASENGLIEPRGGSLKKNPIIQNNTEVLGSFRPETRLLWYAHEGGRMP